MIRELNDLVGAASLDHRRIGKLEKTLQDTEPNGVAQFAKRLGFDLANPFARELKFLTDLLQRASAAIIHPEAKPQDAPLLLVQTAKNIFQGMLKQILLRVIEGLGSLGILNEITITSCAQADQEF